MTEIPVEQWNNWLNKWWKEVDSNPDKTKMNKANPKYVLRNWMAQLAIDAAEEDYTIAEELCKLLENPYGDQPDFENGFKNALNGREIKLVVQCFLIQTEYISKIFFTLLL